MFDDSGKDQPASDGAAKRDWNWRIERGQNECCDEIRDDRGAYVGLLRVLLLSAFLRLIPGRDSDVIGERADLDDHAVPGMGAALDHFRPARVERV
jgi:hypothetical protein